MGEIKLELFWLGGVAEKDDFDKMLENGNTQIAANITQLNYIEGLEEITGKSIKILNHRWYKNNKSDLHNIIYSTF